MKPRLQCPNCAATGFRLEDYESMIVIALDYAMFTLSCPQCGARVSSVCEIPESLHDEIQFAAIEVGAGMGRDC